LFGNGLACTSASQCVSGYCADGYCCNSACGSTCQACDLTGTVGACTTVVAGQDPDSECSAYTCTNYIYGWNGNSCAKYSGATSYNGTCSGSTSCSTVASSCTGVGSASASCGSAGCNKACVASSYYTGYDTVAEVCYTADQHGCSTSYYCNSSGTCVCNGTGTACSSGIQCCSGYCYIDADGDGYAGSSGTATCRPAASAGTDCYDANANARPGQTSSFTANRGDGSFDYNCNSVIIKDSNCSGTINCTGSGSNPCCGGYTSCSATSYTANCGQAWTSGTCVNTGCAGYYQCVVANAVSGCGCFPIGSVNYTCSTVAKTCGCN
jgi:hypothetical protein